MSQRYLPTKSEELMAVNAETVNHGVSRYRIQHFEDSMQRALKAYATPEKNRQLNTRIIVLTRQLSGSR